MLIPISCYRDDPDPGERPATCLYDAESVTGTRALAMDSTDFYLLENYRHYYDPQSREWHKEFYDSLHITHLPMTYRDLRIFLQVKQQEGDKTPDTKEYQKWNIENSKSLCISEEEEKNLAPIVNRKGLRYTLRKSYFFTSMLREGTTITADQTLFGLPAGTDLSSHFMVRGKNFCLPQGPIGEFSFRFWYDEAPVVMSVPDYFATGTWLQECYVLWLKDMPEEIYNEITFTITIPIRDEYWRKYFAKVLPEVRTLERTLRTSCTIHLGEVSTFVQDFAQFSAKYPVIWRL